MLHVGMDMHKRYSVVTVIDEKGKEVVTGRRLNNETGEIKDFLEGLDHQEMKVVLEAGQNWYWMCDLLDGLGVDSRLSHPLKTKAIASAKIKDGQDRLEDPGPTGPHGLCSRGLQGRHQDKAPAGVAALQGLRCQDAG